MTGTAKDQSMMQAERRWQRLALTHLTEFIRLEHLPPIKWRMTCTGNLIGSVDELGPDEDRTDTWQAWVDYLQALPAKYHGKLNSAGHTELRAASKRGQQLIIIEATLDRTDPL